MGTNFLTPNMNLIVPIPGQEPGPMWASDLNASLSTIDSHDHSAGSGVQIHPDGININADLPLNQNNLTSARSVRFYPQGSALLGPSDIGCLYEVGVDLYYNDGDGNNIQMTSGGAVNATSSGISSGTATASFVSSVLVVNAASLTPANIQCGSILLGNNSPSSFFLTLSPPSALVANYQITLPLVPAVNSLVTIDTSGNMGTTPITAQNTNQATFTSSGTFVKPASITSTTVVKVTVVGGGGGGGVGGNTGSSGGSGGGGGGTSILWIAGSSILSSETITVGTSVAHDTNGVGSSFGSHCSASGGAMGTATGTENSSPGGSGGVGLGGTINLGGSDGGGSISATGDYGSGPGGQGGASFMGGGGTGGNNTTSAGVAGKTYGGGGGGGGGVAGVGGSGAGGLILIEWFG